MKKVTRILALVAVSIYCTSCATVFGGHITEAQKTKPKPGEASRQVRVGALVADILLGGPIWTAVDFIDCAIYKPTGNASTGGSSGSKSGTK